MNQAKNKFGDLFESRHLKLLFVFFGIALAARGGVLSRGYAVDDYSFGQGFSKGEIDVFLAQGRFLLAAIDGVIDSLGVNIGDIYVSLGVLSLLLQAGLVLAVLRFVGAADKPGAMVAGSLMVAHPYLAEILTFRMVLPGYCVGALLTIIALEAASGDVRKSRRNFLISLVATVGMLFTYQGFLNYFSIALIFVLLCDAVAGKTVTDLQNPVDRRRRFMNLLMVCMIAVVVFMAILTLSKKTGFIALTSRAELIKFADVRARISEVSDLLKQVYWLGEPMGAHWVKAIIAAMLMIAGFVICLEVFTGPKEQGSRIRKAVCLLAAPVILLASVGVILAFKSWWPVPRVLSQTSLVIGLVFLLAYPILRKRLARIPTAVFAVLPAILLVSFVFKSNQVFADQQRLNAWDAMKMNRIAARLEQDADFEKIEYVFLGGRSWGYPARLKTIQGDMNVSAFYPDYSKLPLLLESTGYRFKAAVGEQLVLGEELCKTSKKWPSKDAVSVVGNLAVVCLND